MNYAIAAAIRWLVAACYCMMILTVPAGAVVPPGALRVFGMDKVIHFIIYGILCFLVCRALVATVRRNLTRNMLLLAFALTLLFGALDEIQQAFIPNRAASIFDLIADGLGALCVVLLWRKATSSWHMLMR